MKGKWKGLLFGPAGVPHSAAKRSTEEGIKQVANLDLDCMELEFVQGVRMKPELARRVNDLRKKLGIELTVHAPYFINLNTKEPEKFRKSIERILDSARIGYLAGAKSVTFHAAFYQKDEPQKVYERVKAALEEILETLDKEGIEIDIRPETTGKPTQFGTLEEILKLSEEFKGRVYPCVDFAHLHARSVGKENTYEEFIRSLELIEDYLGREGLENMHIHISGIAYGPKGERNHLNLEESDMQYRELIQAFIDKDIKGCVVSESPNLEGDAIMLKKLYHELRNK